MSLNPQTDGMQWSAEAAGFFVNMGADFWLPRVADARNLAANVLMVIPRGSMRVQGKHIRFPVRYGHNWEASNAVREQGKLPDPKDKRYAQYAFRPRTQLMRIGIGGDLMRQLSTDAVRFADGLSEAYETAMDDMGLECARMLYNDGSGRLAEVEALPGTPQVTLRMNSSLEGIATCTTTPVDNEFIAVGTRLGFFDPDGTFRGTRTVLSIDTIDPGPPGTATVSMTAALPTAGNAIQVGDWVCRVSRDTAADGSAGEAVNSAFRTEPQGLGGIFQETGVFDGNGLVALGADALQPYATDEWAETAVGNVGFQGLPADGTYPFNQGLVYDGGAILRTPTEELLGAIEDDIMLANNAMVTTYLSNLAERRAHFNSLLPDRRFQDTVKLGGGIEIPAKGGKGWIADRLCHKNCIYLLALESGGFEQSVRTEFQPLDPLGPAWHRPPDDQFWHTSYVSEYTISVDVRNRCGAKVVDISRAAA